MKSLPGILFSCWIFALISACQSTPPPSPTLEVVSEVSPEPTEVIVVEPLVDQNQLDYQVAIEQLKVGEIRAASQALETLINKAPELEYVFTNLGLAYFKQENYQQAEAAFERAISQNKTDAVAYNHLGIIIRLRGDFEKARKNYEKAISIDDEYAPAHLNLGILFDIYLQDLKQALARYQKFQALTNNEDKTVAGWIVDIERRLKSGQS